MTFYKQRNKKRKCSRKESPSGYRQTINGNKRQLSSTVVIACETRQRFAKHDNQLRARCLQMDGGEM